MAKITPYQAADFKADSTGSYYVGDGTASGVFDRIAAQANHEADQIAAKEAFEKGVREQQSKGVDPVEPDKGLLGIIPTISSESYNKGANAQLLANLNGHIDKQVDALREANLYDPEAFSTGFARMRDQIMPKVPELLIPKMTTTLDVLENHNLDQIRKNKLGLELDQQKADINTRMDDLGNRIVAAVSRDPASPDIDLMIGELQGMQEQASNPTKDGPPLFTKQAMAEKFGKLREQIAAGMIQNQYSRQGSLEAKKKFADDLVIGRVSGVHFREETITLPPNVQRAIAGNIYTLYRHEKAEADAARREADTAVKEATAVLASGYTPENGSTVQQALALASPEVRKDYAQAQSWSSTIKAINTMSAPERQAALEQLKERFGANGWTSEEVRAYKTIEARDDAINRMMAADPLAGAAEASDTQLTALNFTDPASVAQRLKDRDRLEALYQTSIPFMTKGEAKNLGALYPTLNEVQQQQYLADIGRALGINTPDFRRDDFNQIMKAISDDHPAVAAMMSRQLAAPQDATGLAQTINRHQNRGMALINDPVLGKDWVKNASDARRYFAEQFSQFMPPTEGGAGIDSNGRSQSLVTDTAFQIYVSLTKDEGDYSGDFSEKRADKAFAMAMNAADKGAIPKVAGYLVAPPKIGMTDFEDRWAVLSDSDLIKAGGGLPRWTMGAAGADLTAKELRDRNIVPVQVDPGRYILMMPNRFAQEGGNDAYTVLSGQDGKPFVLNYNAIDSDLTSRLKAMKESPQVEAMARAMGAFDLPTMTEVKRFLGLRKISREEFSARFNAAMETGNRNEAAFWDALRRGGDAAVEKVREMINADPSKVSREELKRTAAQYGDIIKD